MKRRFLLLFVCLFVCFVYLEEVATKSPSSRRILQNRTPLTNGTALSSSSVSCVWNLNFFFLAKNAIAAGRAGRLGPGVTSPLKLGVTSPRTTVLLLAVRTRNLGEEGEEVTVLTSGRGRRTCASPAGGPRGDPPPGGLTGRHVGSTGRRFQRGDGGTRRGVLRFPFGTGKRNFCAKDSQAGRDRRIA